MSVFYLGKDYGLVTWDSEMREERSNAGPSVVIYRRDSNAAEARYRQGDRTNSLDAVTDSSGNEIATDLHGYDAFGQPRGYDWRPKLGAAFERLHASEVGVTTNNGFTTHEHLDEVYLIHMNGRVYDYRMGRFLSVDPIISNPANSQSINPYSYIGNNPLSGVDPSGFATIALKCSLEGHCVGIQSSEAPAAVVQRAPGASAAPAASSGAKLFAPQAPPASPSEAEAPRQVAQPSQPSRADPPSASASISPPGRAPFLEVQSETTPPNYFGHVDIPLVGLPVPPSMLLPYMRTREPCQGSCLSGDAAGEAQQRRAEQGIARSVSRGEYYARLVAQTLTSLVAGAGQLGAMVVLSEPTTRVIGLRLDADLHRLGSAVTYKNGGWQRAGLTRVDWGRASVDNTWFRRSFVQAAERADAIRFDVTSYSTSFSPSGMTSYELNHILQSPSLLSKTTFIRGGERVVWGGSGFAKP